MAARFDEVTRLLTAARMKFIVIGGWAAALQGSARTTLDVDIVYSREKENIQRLAAVMKGHAPYLRGAPPGLPFTFDEKTIRNGLNFTLTSDTLGDVDFLGEVAGGGTYEQLLPFTDTFEAYGVNVQCVTVERLIQLKRAAGRPKDLEAIAELQAIFEERRNSAPG